MLSWVIVMKRRIFITNTIVVVLALVALLLISSEVIRRVSDHYTSQAPPEEDPGAAQAAELLESWEDSGGWQELNLQLEALGYHLYAARDGEEVFSSLSPLQSDLLRHGGIPASWPEGEAAEIWNGAALLVGIQSGGYTLVAMSRPDLPEFFGQQRPQAEASLLSLLIIGAAAILLIVSLSLISTHFQVKHIMRPVNALADAARRVEAGDYTRPVGYGGQDEFTAVCAAFEQMQHHLLEEREKNAAYERARTDLVAGISHDLRTPLTGIIGNSSLFLESQNDLSSTEQRTIMTNIYEDSNWLLNMVENLLSVTRIQGDSLSINTTEEPVEEVVGEALEKLKKRYPDAAIRVKIPEEFLMIPMDAVLIEQVTINLLENAIVHSGSILPIDFIVEDHPEHVSFIVRDYGKGLSEEKLQNLFETGTYNNSRSSDSRKGMGIGLSICKTIITAHHGTLNGRNHAEGAEFCFTLPKNTGKDMDHRNE